jgi:dGTPase
VPRLPPRLHDLVELARVEYGGIHAAPAEVNRLARDRTLIDYVHSLTDGQASVLRICFNGRSGRTGRLWTVAAVL